MLTLDKIYHAAFVLKDVARKTDLIEAPKLSKDCQLYLKTENLQATGSFKVRGAYYKISQLSPEESAKGVIACSAGNHAQGVALAATRRGIKSIVCMPDGAPIMKVENTKNLGAEVCLVPGTYDDAHDKAVELQEETGMTFIHPYDDEQVIAGQGTIGLEILDQLPDLDAALHVFHDPIGHARQVASGHKARHMGAAQHLHQLVLDLEAHDVFGAVVAGHAWHLHGHWKARVGAAIGVGHMVDVRHAARVHQFADHKPVENRPWFQQLHRPCSSRLAKNSGCPARRMAAAAARWS